MEFSIFLADCNYLVPQGEWKLTAAAIQEEREACAKICDAEADRQEKESGPAAYNVPASNCAVSIRARCNTYATENKNTK